MKYHCTISVLLKIFYCKIKKLSDIRSYLIENEQFVCMIFVEWVNLDG